MLSIVRCRSIFAQTRAGSCPRSTLDLGFIHFTFLVASKVFKKIGCHAVSDAAVAAANCDVIGSRVPWRSSNDFLRAGS